MNVMDPTASARDVALARYRLRWHVPVYVLVNTGLVVAWWANGGGFFWPVFPVVFWGLGVLLHYRAAYSTAEETWVDQETATVLRERGHAGDR